MILRLTLWNPLIGLWCFWVFTAIIGTIQNRKFARRVERPTREGFDTYHPKTAVIVPFKGHDHELPNNIRSLVTQDFPQYRLVFVLESKNDLAYEIIKLELENHPDAPQVDFLFPGAAPGDTGQKVFNLLRGMEFLDAMQDDSEVWVFADSDAVPSRHWLQKMVGPHIQNDRIGVTTGYRWLMPQLKAQRPKLSAALGSVVNSSVASFIGHGNLTQAWGGSMATRVDFAKQQDLYSYFRGSITDDFQLTRMCREGGKRVYFVPHCLVATPIDFTWPALFEFARRQYLITRVHDTKLFYKAWGLIALYVVSNLSALAVLIFALCTGRYILACFPALALITIAIANQFRAAYRRQAVTAAFGTDALRYLRVTLWLDRWATIACMCTNLALLSSAAFGKHITWRTIRYRLDGPGQTVRLSK